MSDQRQITLFSSAARTTTVNSADQSTQLRGKGLHFVLDITAVSGTPTLDMKVQRKDAVSGQYVDILGAAFAQKSGVGTDDLVISPGIA